MSFFDSTGLINSKSWLDVNLDEAILRARLVAAPTNKGARHYSRITIFQKHKTMIHSLTFMKLLILRLYDNDQQIPKAKTPFVLAVMKTICKKENRISIAYALPSMKMVVASNMASIRPTLSILPGCNYQMLRCT